MHFFHKNITRTSETFKYDKALNQSRELCIPCVSRATDLGMRRKYAQ